VADLGDISVNARAVPIEGEESLRVAISAWPDITRAVPPLDDAQLAGITTKAYAWISG
jgi:hypothetical protein